MKIPRNGTYCCTSTRRFAIDESGLSTVEYVIILVLIAVSAIGIWGKFGQTIVDKITTSKSQIDGMDPTTGASGH